MILVLVMGLRLPVLDAVESEEVLNSGANLSFGTIAHEALHSSMLSDEVLQGGAHV